MRRAVALALVMSACSHPAVPVDGAQDTLDVTDIIATDATVTDTAAVVDTGPPLVQLPPSTRTLRDLIGIASNPGDFPESNDTASEDRRAYYLRKLQQAGITRLRRDFTWAEIEPTPGTFDYTPFDRIATETSAAGVTLLATLDYGNPWASHVPDASMWYPPDDPSTFANFATHTARHYLGRIHDYEIWNEPNVGFRFWLPTGSGDPIAFGALALAASRAITAVDPDASVAYGGTSYLPEVITGGIPFAARSFDANPGLATALTAYAFHAYDWYPPQNPPESDAGHEVPLLEKFARTATMLQSAGYDLRHPLWITEIGWPTDMQVSEADQARFTMRSVLLSAFAGADGVYIYTLGDGPNPDAYPPEDAFGLVHYDPDWTDGVDPPDKPSFVALTALIATLGNFRVLDRVAPAGAPPDVFILHLTDGAHDAWAVWRVDPSGEPFTWTVPVTGANASAIDGTSISIDATSNAVTPGIDPVYVIAP